MKTTIPKSIELPRSATEQSKLQEFLELQRQYKRTFLARKFSGEKLAVVREQIKTGKITFEVNGLKYSDGMMRIEHDMQQLGYFELLVEEKRLFEKLKYHGMKEKEILALLNENKFVKSIKGDDAKAEGDKKKGDYIG